MDWFQVLWLFFCYSFLGWVLEVVFEAAVNRRYVDRGVLNGPLCVIYGVAGTRADTYAAEIGAKFVAIEKNAENLSLNVTELSLEKGKTYRLIPS